MKLTELYKPIQQELDQVELALHRIIGQKKNGRTLAVINYLLAARGKRIRPALVLLSAKAVQQVNLADQQSLVSVSAAVELIHLASLIHDDVMDHASLRHSQPTLNAKYGQDVAISVGDYLYSRAFELVASCGNLNILASIGQATCAMCEGELVQVCERDNLNLQKERYFNIIKNKTASLFAVSCKAGANLADSGAFYERVLADYGMDFGISFQIVDDSLDLIGSEDNLGKAPGIDFNLGEVTLPILNLISQSADKEQIIALLGRPGKAESFQELRQKFINSPALQQTKEDIQSYIRKAKNSLGDLKESCFKESLLGLTDFLAERVSI